MKKIYVLAGVVLFISFVLMCWVFFGNFFDFAQNLGEKSSDISLDEKSKFIGIWETTYVEDDERFVGYDGTYKFNPDGTGLIGGIFCTWDIVDEKLVISYFEGTASLVYNYSFSDDENTLTLTDNKGSLEFIKHQI